VPGLPLGIESGNVCVGMWGSQEDIAQHTVC
jgi:hypothetical protein